MKAQTLKQTLEALLMASERPLTLDELLRLLLHQGAEVRRGAVQKGLDALADECEGRGVELKQVASGYRYQTREKFSAAIAQLWEEKPPRYSRALLETLALIAYRQPITRAEIEEVRGVSVSTYMVRLLEEREWIRVAGHKEVPGRPALYATTKEFLDYFNLHSLDELPTLLGMEEVIRMHPELQIEPDDDEAQGGAQADADQGEDDDPPADAVGGVGVDDEAAADQGEDDDPPADVAGGVGVDDEAAAADRGEDDDPSADAVGGVDVDDEAAADQAEDDDSPADVAGGGAKS